MNLKKLAVQLFMVSAACVAGPGLASASGNAKAIKSYCSGDPSSKQVFLYNSTLEQCWTLELNELLIGDLWGGYDASEGFPNDTVVFARIGSSVRIKFFWNWFYTHDEGGVVTINYPGSNTQYAYLGSPMAGNASAARVELSSQPQYCSAQSGYLSIYDTPGAPTSGDCTMLSNLNHYSDPVKMAFRNDNMSAWVSGPSTRSFDLYNSSNYGSWLTSTWGRSCYIMSNLSAYCAIYNYGDNNSDNKVSSVY